MKRLHRSLTNRFLKQNLFLVILPVSLCIFLAFSLRMYSQSRVQEVLKTRWDTVLTELETKHEASETLLNMQLMKCRTVQEILIQRKIDPADKAKKLFAAQQELKNNSVQYAVNGNCYYISLMNRVFIGMNAASSNLDNARFNNFYGTESESEWIRRYLHTESIPNYLRDYSSYDGSKKRLTDPVITRSSYMPNKASGYGYWILISWPEDVFIADMNIQMNDGENFELLNSAGEVLLSVLPDDIDTLTEPDRQETDGYIGTVHGKRMFITNVRSRKTGLQIIAAIDYSLAMQPYENVILVIDALIFVFLLLCILISIRFARKNAHPLQQIMTLLKLPEDTDISSHYYLMIDAIIQLTQKTDTIEENIRTQDARMRQMLVSKLFYDSANFSDTDQERLGIPEDQYFGVAVVYLLPPIPQDTETGLQVVLSMTEQVLTEKWQGRARISYDHSKLFILFSLPTTNEDAELESCITETTGILNQIPSMDYYIGIGQTAHEIFEIKEAFSTALISARYARRKKLTVVWYQEIRKERRFVFSLEKEEQLSAILRAGNMDDADRFLEKLRQEAKGQSEAVTAVMTEAMLAMALRISEDYKEYLSEEMFSQLDQLIVSAGKNIEESEHESNLNKCSDLILHLCEEINLASSQKDVQRQDSLLAYIQQHYADPDLSLQNVLEYFRISQNSLQEILREVTGMTFYKYLESVRLQHACRLLAESRKQIQEIAQKCGYASDMSFRRVFKEKYGMTPGQYRESQKTGSGNV